ncbi:exodeoxyribonuclease V subunit gamma [Aquabacterium sp. OR-4]|uniref:exodeoxyribonuclease V subunit gamma n=1 Tax=Aquabacterium sp. OR-4 TaxID=2978127 RepID=UPI0021B18A3D|nr:exodeoxyribonuclease V subunit gamma [Aquabacterium sp. OR-4]MDT7833654.1 exodeoxyribonuclease V subunit gamma [Aquabacterium sp. OR-4]
MSDTLTPGFLVVHGNHPEALRALMLQWLAAHPLPPLADETVLVQSNGVAQWLKLAMARPPRADGSGGLGIAAAVKMLLPSRFQWDVYRAVLGPAAVPPVSPFDKPLLLWRLMRLLPALLAEPVFAPLQRFLADDADLRKRHQLAERLADLLDQYQVYRADWLADWAAGDDRIATSRQGLQPVPDDLRWQPRLWRALLADVAAAAEPGGDVDAGTDAGTDAGAAAAATSRAAVHQQFLQRMADWAPARDGPRPAGLPRRLVVFGISSLPQQALQVLAALARFTQVLMCVHNPCEHDWSHIVADKDLLRAERQRQRRRPGSEGAIADEALHLHAQPLLAAWGKQGRDFIRLLDEFDGSDSAAAQAHARQLLALGQRIDLFEATPGHSLLAQLQDDIRDLRPLAETRARWPAVDAARDRSIQLHITHGPQREVEVLHDQLLQAMAADATLQPRDVIVMVPDIAAYAPHVQAVFGLLPSGDARHIPYSLADQGQRGHDPLLGALEKLLALPQSRLAVSDVLDLLEVPALRRRFAIADDQLPLLRRWLQGANIRWGLHAAQRAALGLPPDQPHNSWDSGLQRMLLGYASGVHGAGEAWLGIEPLDEIGGLDAALLGPLVTLLATLERHWQALAEPVSPNAWGERLNALLADCFDTDAGPAAGPPGGVPGAAAKGRPTDGLTLLRLQTTLQDWLAACASAALVEPLPLAVVREHWLAALDAGGLSQPFFAGAVTFATLMPMRAIPFRIVALLGMNDGDYPRSRVPMDFDLMGAGVGGDWRPGDRSRREDDRYLFLEALLSARERLHISWVGRSIHDQSERAPSVLVAQLRDHLAAGWQLAGAPADHPHDHPADRPAGQALVAALSVEHPLQPFDAAYFTQGGDPRLSSHAHEWRDGLCAVPQAAPPAGDAGNPGDAGNEGDPGDAGSAALPPWAFEGPLTLRLLAEFLANPARSFLRQRLGVFFEADDPVGADQEPFAVDALENWQLQDELIQAQLAALEAGDSREHAMQAQLQRMARRGALPAGHFAELVQQQLAAPMDDLFARYTEQLGLWPQTLPDALLDHLPEGLPEPLRLLDWLGQLRANAQGQRVRLLLDSGSLIANKRYRRDRLVAPWVAHLAAHLGAEPITTVVVSKAGTATLMPLDAASAKAAWAALLAAWQQGLTQPLPLALRSAFEWLDKGGADAGPDSAEAHAAARAAYEDHEPAHGLYGEREGNAYLARAFTGFDALWAGGEFAHWALALLAPLDAALQRADDKPGKGRRAAAGLGADA